MSEGREWLAKSVQEGFIKHYSEDDLIERTFIDDGGHGVVFKAKMKHSGIPVAIKTLHPNLYGEEEDLYSHFVKEVATSYLLLFFINCCCHLKAI